MKKKNPFAVKLGARGYPMTESAAGFEHPDLLGTWHVLEGQDRYVLCEDRGRRLRFIEFVKKSDDSWVLYKAREWERLPRDDNQYTLTKDAKYHGKQMSTGFLQALKNACKKPEPA
ncbi:MAG: hypothetical protein HY517_01570 [Candidatus Aenigmarchaeota archaeon]|nr:hypothetical protein [Candidatus Aenigmarchaeota archaeon]